MQLQPASDQMDGASILHQQRMQSYIFYDKYTIRLMITSVSVPIWVTTELLGFECRMH